MLSLEKSVGRTVHPHRQLRSPWCVHLSSQNSKQFEWLPHFRGNEIGWMKTNFSICLWKMPKITHAVTDFHRGFHRKSRIIEDVSVAEWKTRRQQKNYNTATALKIQCVYVCVCMTSYCYCAMNSSLIGGEHSQRQLATHKIIANFRNFNLFRCISHSHRHDHCHRHRHHHYHRHCHRHRQRHRQ